jgi:hypothetical protein
MSETATTTETAETKTEAASSTQTATATETAATLIGTAAESKTEQAASDKTQTTETKTEATKADEKTETKTETKAEGAPEKYEFKDADKLDPQVMGAFSEAAKDANLTQEAAQKLLDKVAPALQARNEEQVKAVHQQWTEASTSDKEFGGEKLKENLGVARKALDQFGTPELKQFLETTGLGSHPEVIRLLFKAGKAISEDKFVGGGRTAATQSPESVLYPTMNTK